MRALRFPASVALLAGTLLAPTTVFGHGASRGLHLHVSPEPATIGVDVEIAADASEPVAWLKVGFVGRDPVEVRPERPAKHLAAKLAVPPGKPSSTVSVQAEARTVGGRTLRASAVLVLPSPARAAPARSGPAPTSGEGPRP